MNLAFLFLLALLLTILNTCRTPVEDSKSKDVSARDYVQNLQLPNDFTELAGSIKDSSPKVMKYSSRLSDESIYFQNTERYPFHLDFLNKFLYNGSLNFSTYTKLIFGDENSKDLDAGAIQYSPTFAIETTLKDCNLNNHVFKASAGTVVFEVYLLEGQAPTPEVVLEKFKWIERTHRKLSETIKFAGKASPQNIAYLIPPAWVFGACALRQKFVDAGIPVVLFNQKFIDAFLGKGDVAIYHGGKSYGFLNEISKEDLYAGNYSSKDILLIDEIPLDIGPLSGIISSIPQVPLSHIMLRAINQNIPDIYVKDARAQASISSNIGKLVEFDVNSEKGYSIRGPDIIGEAKLEQLAKDYWDNRVPKLPPLESDLRVKKLLSWKSQNPDKSLAKFYGSKGTNFAILDQILTGTIDRSEYENGFLIPFRHFKDHVTNNVIEASLCKEAAKDCEGDFGKPCSVAKVTCDQNTGLSLNDFIHSVVLTGKSKSRMDAEASFRREHLFFVQNLIRGAKLDQSLEKEVFDKILANYPERQRIRFRSSTNAEDLRGLNGAGLYESTGGCIADENYPGSGPSLCMTQREIDRKASLIARLSPLLGDSHPIVLKLKGDLHQKRSIKRAIRKVFASLWTESAYLSREYYRLNHQEVYMGILVHSSFFDEEANGVAVIKDNGGGSYEFQVSVQAGDISVTNPEVPGAMPEVFTLNYDSNTNAISNLIYATRSSETKGAEVLTSAHIDSLAEQAVLVSKEFVAKHILIDGDVLDIEFKVDGENRVQIKQGRPLTVK